MTTTPAPTNLDLAELAALERKASPAPWRADRDGADGVIRFPDGDTCVDVWADDAALIAAMRNALPALLDELAKTRAELDEIKAAVVELAPANLVPDHLRGDGPCQDCGTADNIRWFAPNAVWNHVMGGTRATDDPGGIVCIPCFVKHVDAAGFAPTVWQITPTVWQITPNWFATTAKPVAEPKATCGDATFGEPCALPKGHDMHLRADQLPAAS